MLDHQGVLRQAHASEDKAMALSRLTQPPGRKFRQGINDDIAALHARTQRRPAGEQQARFSAGIDADIASLKGQAQDRPAQRAQKRFRDELAFDIAKLRGEFRFVGKHSPFKK